MTIEVTQDETEGRAEQLLFDLSLVTEEQFGKAIGVTTQTLTEWRCKKIGPAYVKLGRTVFYNIDDIREWCNRKRVHTTESAAGFVNAAYAMAADK